MVSFDVVSLFTKVPIKDTMDLLGRHFAEDILRLFRHVLTVIPQLYGKHDMCGMI
jgi:hypothetical protein